MPKGLRGPRPEALAVGRLGRCRRRNQVLRPRPEARRRHRSSRPCAGRAPGEAIRWLRGPPPRTVIQLAAAAAAELPAWIAQWKPERVICGYDADRAGDLGTRSLERWHGRDERLRSEGRKDWNDILRDGRAQNPS
ncbi:MAG: hypothetical protein OXC26_06305 [Albidovulum sp.]|nr:hypothetical protein [Albidovulum sp.]